MEWIIGSGVHRGDRNRVKKRRKSEREREKKKRRRWQTPNEFPRAGKRLGNHESNVTRSSEKIVFAWKPRARQ